MLEQEIKQQLPQFVTQKRCVLYARTSSGDKQTDSLPSQISVCEAYAKEMGYTIVDRLSEDIGGVKGDDRDAPALNRALEMARAGLYDVLVIRDVKRFSRGVYKAMDFESRFFDNGIDIEYSWNKELNGLPRRGTGFVHRFLQYWMSEEDRKHIVSKLYYKRIEKVRDRKSVMTHQRPPYGYVEAFKIVDGRKVRTLAILESEAKWVIKIFEWYVYDRLSLRAIQRKLKENCVPRPSERKPITGGLVKETGEYDWSHTSVRTILGRETYIGYWEYGKERKQTTAKNSIIADELIQEAVGVEIPPIISQELFNATGKLLEANKKRTHKKSKYKFLMRGRAKCRVCGRACLCAADKRNDYRMYRCHTSYKKTDPANTKACKLPTFKRDVIDPNGWQWLIELVEDETELKRGYEEYLELKQNEVTPLQDELKRIEENLSDLNDRLAQQVQAVKMLVEIGSTKATEGLKTEIMQTESLITRNEDRQAEIEAQLKDKSVSVDIITDFGEFVSKVRIGIKKAHGNFEKQREIIELLGVKVEFDLVNGEPEYTFSCVLKPNANLYKSPERPEQDSVMMLKKRFSYSG